MVYVLPDDLLVEGVFIAWYSGLRSGVSVRGPFTASAVAFIVFFAQWIRYISSKVITRSKFGFFRVSLRGTHITSFQTIKISEGRTLRGKGRIFSFFAAEITIQVVFSLAAVLASCISSNTPRHFMLKNNYNSINIRRGFSNRLI